MPIFFLVILVFLVIFYMLYVSLIKKKNKVREASSGIDVQLKKRYDLLPNLLETAATFMQHERHLLEDITRLRTDAMKGSFAQTPKEVAQIENELSSKLKEFNIAVENYPDLKSNQTMVQLMQSLSDVEEHIAAARRFYNAAANDLNNAVEIFPSNIIARSLNIEPVIFFETTANEKQPVHVGDYFK